MKLKLILVLVLINLGTIKAQEKLEIFFDFDKYEINMGANQKLVDFNRRFIKYFDTDMEPYDVLLDNFEEGMNMVKYDEFFDTLKRDLVPFVRKVLKEGKPLNKDFTLDSFDT